MKFPLFPLKYTLPVCIAVLATPLCSFAADRILPAGSLLQCTISEPKVSSQTEKIGDPILCLVNHVQSSGRTIIPFGSSLVGHFEDYKDPGRLVGKGWIELKFDRLIVHDNVIPLDARVVSVPKYGVNADGHILGKGHPVRDTVEWLIPVLWPVDLINLPRRGPRVILKAETRLTLKLLDDVDVPTADDTQRQPGLFSRNQEPAPLNIAPQQAPAPIVQSYAQPAQSYAQPAPSYAQAPATVIYEYAPPPPPQVVYQTVYAPPVIVRYAPPPPPPYGYAAPYGRPTAYGRPYAYYYGRPAAYPPGY